VLSPSAEVPITDPLVSAPVELTFLGLIIPSFIGLILGIGVLTLVRFGSNTPSRIGRAITIAVLVTITLVSAYLMLQSALSGRLSIAIFLLTFGIGALVHYIFTRGTPEASSLRTRLPFRNDL
jgi:multisubunit Na+/H+ antiporter MnhE subunit